MSEGIQAEVSIGSPADCPIATVSASASAPAHSIARCPDPTAPGRTVEEFVLDGELDGATAAAAGIEAERVFDYGPRGVYRFERETGCGCACERIERFGCPVTDVHARDGRLDMTFHARDIEQLQQAIGELKTAYDSLQVKRLLRTRGDLADHDIVLFDTQELTDRQREVLETAHSMGYFEHPRTSNAGEVAAALSITTTTFTEHLAAAQRKLLAVLVAE